MIALLGVATICVPLLIGAWGLPDGMEKWVQETTDKEES